MTKRQIVEIAGMAAVAAAAWFLHPAATVAVVGISAVLLANFGDFGGGNDTNTG